VFFDGLHWRRSLSLALVYAVTNVQNKTIVFEEKYAENFQHVSAITPCTVADKKRRFQSRTLIPFPVSPNSNKRFHHGTTALIAPFKGNYSSHQTKGHFSNQKQPAPRRSAVWIAQKMHETRRLGGKELLLRIIILITRKIL